MKKRDKRDYIIIFQTAVCAVLIILLIRENTDLKKEIKNNDKEAKKTQAGLKMKNATLSSQNTLKGIKISSLQSQLDALNSQGTNSGVVDSINALKKLSKNIDKLNKANLENSKLKSDMKNVQNESKNQIGTLSEEIEKLKTELANVRYKKKSTYKPKKKYTYKKRTPTKRTRVSSSKLKRLLNKVKRKPASTTTGASKYRYSPQDQVESLGDVFEK